MDKEQLFQNAAYASAEAKRLSFADRLKKRADQPMLRRLGKAAAGNLFKHIVDVPQLISEPPRQFELINNGLSNLVYASADQVMKVNVRTLSDVPEKVELEVQKSVQIFDMCKEYMGRHWLDTSYNTRQFLGKSVVESRQPRLYPVTIFESVEELLDHSDDEAYIDELESLFESIAELYINTGFYPDLLGANNIALIEDEASQPTLVILDTDPASPAAQQQNIPNQDILIKDAMAQKLQMWSAFLARSKERPVFREEVLQQI